MTVSQRKPLGSATILILAACLVHEGVAQAQERGSPVYFDLSYSYDTRVGLDLAHGGESDGLSFALNASRLFYVGCCRRLAVSGALGIWDSPQQGLQRNVNAGVGGSYLLNKCPRPTSAPNPTWRLQLGGGLTRVEDFTAFHGYAGVGVGTTLPVPIVHVVGWATPRLHYRESLTVPDTSDLDIAFSTGLDIGVGAIHAGIRIAADCCQSGLGWDYGLSMWW